MLILSFDERKNVICPDVNALYMRVRPWQRLLMIEYIS